MNFSDRPIRRWLALLYGVRKILAQIAFTVVVRIDASVEVSIAVIANVLPLHAHVLTRHIHVAFVAPEVAVIIVTIAHPLVALVTVMIGRILVRAVDDSVTKVTIVVFVIVYVNTNEFSATFPLVAVSVVIIVEAIGGHPYTAAVAGVIVVVILVVDIIGIFFTRSFLSASVTDRVLIRVGMRNTLQFVAANFAAAKDR